MTAVPTADPPTRADVDTAAPASSPTPRSRRARLLPALLVAALVASLAVNGLLLRDRHHQSALDDARAEALQAGRAMAVALTTYDSRTLDADFARVRAGAVDPFAGQFARASGSLERLIGKYHGSARGRIVRYGVTSVSEDRVQLVFFVDQSIRNAMQKGSREDRNRIAMTLVRTDGTWKVSEADLV